LLGEEKHCLAVQVLLAPPHRLGKFSPLRREMLLFPPEFVLLPAVAEVADA
jgi:hypothetical protein